MKNLVDSIKMLENSIDIFSDDLRDLQSKSERFKTIDEALIQKSIEDGIIKHIEKASDYQLSIILDPCKGYFRYYSEIYDLIENGVEFKKLVNGKKR